MPDVKIEIVNLDKVVSAFQKAPQLMAKEMKDAIKRSTFQIQKASMQNTPVDTGRLRASHETFFTNNSGTVQTDVFYDVFVHEGTKFMKARPFMRRGAEESEDEVEEFFTRAVDKVLSAIGNAT